MPAADTPRAVMPVTGMAAPDVLNTMESFRADDVRWREGRAFSLVYDAGDAAVALAKESYARFSAENALNLDAFPSLRHMQRDVINITCGLLGSPDGIGVFTAGGTESILTAVHGARSWGRARGIQHPRMVLPTSAHAAFSKAAAYFDVEAVRVPVGLNYKADPAAMAAAIGPNTVLLVGSAPSYPQGVIDPIAHIAALAVDHNILCHVDACMGFTLPFLERLGHVQAPWGFTVPGVTSISCDLHKYGYAAKGASILAFREKDLRRHAGFVTDDWLGGLYGSPALLGTRSGGGIASAWALFHHLGMEGYDRLTATAWDTRVALERAIRSIESLVVRGQPEATLLAFGSADPSLDIYAVGDELWKRGWYVDRQTPPDSLHCTVNAVHSAHLDEFVADLKACIAHIRADGADTKGDRTRAYGTIS
jgi:sphinganine-1-phosphate aldolase